MKDFKEITTIAGQLDLLRTQQRIADREWEDGIRQVRSDIAQIRDQMDGFVRSMTVVVLAMTVAITVCRFCEAYYATPK